MRLLLSLLLTVPLLSGCVSGTTTIALLLADAEGGTRTFDADAFTERVQTTCGECAVEVYDAAGVEADQRDQVAQALDADARLIVIEPVSPEDAEGYDAGEDDVVSIVQLVPGSDRFVGIAEPLELGGATQGSDLEAARQLVMGERPEMVHVPTREISEQAADVAVGLLANSPTEGGVEHEGVESWLYEAVTVTLDNLTTVLVGDGAISLEELCEAETAKRCQRLGFS